MNPIPTFASILLVAAPGPSAPAKGTLDFSQLRGALSVHPDGAPTYEFSSLHVNADGAVNIRTTFLSMPSFQTTQAFTIACRIGRGVTFHVASR